MFFLSLAVHDIDPSITAAKQVGLGAESNKASDCNREILDVEGVGDKGSNDEITGELKRGRSRGRAATF